MKLLLHKIKRNKQRYISIVLALTIIQGILFVAINLLTVLKWNYFPDSVFELETDKIYNVTVSVDSEQRNEYENLIFTPQFIDEINTIDGIEKCGGELEQVTKYIDNWRIRSNSDTTINLFYNFAGIYFYNIYDIELLKGTLLSTSSPGYREVLLTETTAKHFGVFDKSLPFNIVLPRPPTEGVGITEFNVCGIIKDLGFFSITNQNNEVFPLITSVGRTTTVQIRLKEDSNPTEVQAKISELVRREYGHLNPRIEMVSFKNVLNNEWEEDKAELLPIILLIPLILFYTLIAMFGLFWNDMEHKKVDFAIMRAIGFNKKNIFKIIVSEALFLTAISSLINVFLIFNFKPQLDSIADQIQSGIGLYESWLASTLGIVILILTASFAPAFKTTQIQAAEALSEE